MSQDIKMLFNIIDLWETNDLNNQELAIQLCKNTHDIMKPIGEYWHLVISTESFDRVCEGVGNIENLMESNQELLCKLCEEHILCNIQKSRLFLCEGRWCEEASEYLIEYIDEQQQKLMIADTINSINQL